MAAAQHDAAHLPAVGHLVENDRALAVRVDQGVGVVRLDQMDFHFAVHAQGELVVGAGIPGRLPLRAQHLDDIFEILADGDALVGRAPARNVEHVGEHIVFRVVVDGVDAAGRKVVQPAEHGLVLRHCLSSLFLGPKCSFNEHMFIYRTIAGWFVRVNAKIYTRRPFASGVASGVASGAASGAASRVGGGPRNGSRRPRRTSAKRASGRRIPERQHPRNPPDPALAGAGHIFLFPGFSRNMKMILCRFSAQGASPAGMEGSAGGCGAANM